MVSFVLVEKRMGDRAVVNLRNLRSKHRSAIMASGFLLSAASQAFVSLNLPPRIASKLMV